jgi:uncharacterized protein with HEPN domain
MARSAQVALTDIQSAIALAREAARHISLADFAADRIRRAATERALLTISEAVRHLPDDLTACHPHVPWKDIKGIGNFIRHEYWTVDAKIVWEVVQHQLDALETAIAFELTRVQS